MPEEVAIIAVFAIIFGSITLMSIVWAISRAIQSRSRGTDTDSSLTRSELQRLLHQAVEDATRPLYAKIDGLERKLDREQAALEPGRRGTPQQLEAREEVRRELASGPHLNE